MVDLTKTTDYFPNSSFALEDFYRALFSSPELAVYVIRADKGVFTFHDANEEVARIAGRPLVEIRGKTPEECLPPFFAECLTVNLRRCSQMRESVSYLRTYDLPQGRKSWTTILMPVSGRFPAGEFIVGQTRDVSHLWNLVENADHNAALLRTLGIALPSAIYLNDIQTRQFRYIGAEEDRERQVWRKQVEAAGATAATRFCHPEEHARIEAHFERLAGLADGEVCEDFFRILTSDGTYLRHRTRETVFSRDPAGRVQFVLGVSEDVSEEDRARREVRDISARMETMQVDERRKIAQELHDSTGQHLTVVGLALARARAVQPQCEALEEHDAAELGAALGDAALALGEAQREIRVLSYLLHPPHIRSEGLADALRTFAEGFGKRAGLAIELSVSPEASRLDDDGALQVFRICQEALTNVYRHAQARKAVITFEVEESTASLTVEDDGIGFDAAATGSGEGLGLSGMRERMARLGGEIELTSCPGRTVLVARIPRDT